MLENFDSSKKKLILAAAILYTCVSYNFAFALEGIDRSIVKIRSVANAHNYQSPWLMPQQYDKFGTGFILKGNIIVTNAHVVAGSAYVEVRRADNTIPYQASVAIIDHDCDLAVLEIQDKAFFNNALFLDIAKDVETGDKAHVYGFPIGGNKVSLTQGVVSRLEIQEYAHSGMHFLLAQIDAAINPGNSGGPVLVNGKVAGVATQGYDFGQNLGYMIPVQILDHFLRDVATGSYKGFPSIGILAQGMENPAIREKYSMDKSQSGVLITKVKKSIDTYEPPSFEVGDIILNIEGMNVDNNGTIELNTGSRVRMGYLVTKHFIGEVLKVAVLRKATVVDISVTLKDNKFSRLVPGMQHEKSPRYYIFGGLIFQPLTLDLLVSIGGSQWPMVVSSILNHYYRQGEKSLERDEVVVLSRVLPDISTIGYQDVRNVVVSKINGTSIKNIRHLIEIVKNSKEDLLTITLQDEGEVVISKKMSKAANENILAKYKIPSDRSI